MTLQSLPIQGPALEPITLSASQISTWRGCQRQWAWKYIERLQSESTPAQLLGTETENEQLQPYLLQGRAFEYTTTEGKPKPSGEIAATSLPYLPKPLTPGLEMQRHFLMPSPTFIIKGEWTHAKKVHCGITYQGYIDLWHVDSRALGFEPYELGEPGSGMTSQIPGVEDFKTTSDLIWAKTKEQLAVDVQAMLYATHALYTTRAPAVDLGWIYMQTKGTRKAKRTVLRVLPDHVMEQFQAIDATGQEIAAVRREGNKGNVKPLDLPPSPEMCSAYGGCPFQSKCNLSPAQIIDAYSAQADRLLNLKAPSAERNQERNEQKDNTMTQGLSMLDQLRAKKAAADQTPTPAAMTAPAAPVAMTAPVAATAPPLLSSPAVPNAAAPHIIGVTTEGTNVYAHDVANFTRIGQYPDGRALYMRNAEPVATPPAVPVVTMSNPPPIASASAFLGSLPGATSAVAQPINPPESALAPAPAVGAEPAKPKRGRPFKTPQDASPAPQRPPGTALTIGVDVHETIAFAQALKAGCEAFLAAIADSAGEQ